MLSQSRFKQATSQFISTLSQISNEISNYYFQYSTPNQPYKMKRHLTQLYNFVYENCTSKPAKQDKMLQTYKLVLQKHIVKQMSMLQRCGTDSNNSIISIYNLIWQSYTSYTLLLSKRIFIYLNRYYIPSSGNQSLNSIGLKLFMTSVLTQNMMRLFMASYMNQLDKIRKNKIVSHCELLKLTQSFAILDNNNLFSLIKEVFMIHTTKYYKQLFEKNCNNEPIQYFNMVINERYFQGIVVKKCICFTQNETSSLQQLFNDQLVKKYTHIFCVQPYGFSYLLRRHRIADLRLVCQVYEKVQKFEELKKFLYDFILEEGNVILTQKSKSANSQEFIDCYYQFYNDYFKLINECFQKIPQMLVSFKSAIQKLLSKYDRITEDLFKITRNNLDSRVPSKFDSINEKIVAVFQKLPYKDQYLNLYRNSLQKKIIHGSLIYMIQKNFIQTMNNLCGNDMTNQLDKILQDFVQTQLLCLHIKIPNFQIKVVSLHFWQKKFQDQITMNLTLVQPLLKEWQMYEQKYLNIFAKRRLILLPYQTKIILRVFNHNKEITMKCSLIQACIILFLTNNKQKIARQQQIIESLTIQKTFLHRFLEEYPNLITEDEHGFYNFNWNFQTIDDYIDLDSRVQQQKKVTKHIKQDRQILIQCAIAKIMKKSKQVQLQELVHKVSQHIKLFKPLPSNIKSGIQTLKKKQIIQQTQDGRIIYKQ